MLDEDVATGERLHFEAQVPEDRGARAAKCHHHQIVGVLQTLPQYHGVLSGHEDGRDGDQRGVRAVHIRGHVHHAIVLVIGNDDCNGTSRLAVFNFPLEWTDAPVKHNDKLVGEMCLRGLCHGGAAIAPCAWVPQLRPAHLVAGVGQTRAELCRGAHDLLQLLLLSASELVHDEGFHGERQVRHVQLVDVNAVEDDPPIDLC
mmetsp:Transcript_9672/g.14899  ORF Transcript_9672/g.14899 Transcript_9672/m.14899 type:complete len:202 (-) Transcript_9672:103-708(-)